jgi:NAD-dependent dihydropyrimidine dehydrogenase PreA subunit
MPAENQNQKTNSEKSELVGKDSAVNPPEAAAKPVRRRSFRITVYEAWCKKCGICVAFCPASALREHETTQQVLSTAAKCTGCRQCEWRCPDFAIVIKPAAAEPSDSLTAGNKSEGEE